MNNTVLYILLGLLVVSAVFTATIKNTLKAVIALAVVSSVLTVIMFLMGAPLASVFELSVCAGLVTAIFVSTISLTAAPSDDADEKPKKRLNRYIFLPIILVVVIGIIFITKPALDFSAIVPANDGKSVLDMLWHSRNLDLAGVIVVILAGVFGVVVLLKEKSKN